MADCVELVFFVNGRKIVEKDVDPETTLLHYLRKKLCLTGVKLACGEGGCGACTVMVSRYDHKNKKIIHYTVNACLARLCAMHGLAVTTVEGIGSIKNGLHPIQDRIAKSYGSQCGFCTPGIVMSMYTLIRNNSSPTTEQMETALEGNLCRCTGYRPILEGFKTFSKEYCGLGEKCCKNSTQPCEKMKGDCKDFIPLDSSQDPIFPPELQHSGKFDRESLKFIGERTKWFRPVTLQELLLLKTVYPDARLVVGNTEVGIEMQQKNMHYPVLVCTTNVPNLQRIEQMEHGIGIKVGANVTIARLEHFLKNTVEKFSDHSTRVFTALIEMLRWFAGSQIRNMASVGGNVMTASPISDLNPLFMASRAVLEVASEIRGKRQIVMNEKFFKGYRQTALEPDEVLISVTIPFTCEDEYFYGYKQAHRKDDDIAIVNAGLRVLFENKSNTIADICLCFGGMAPVTVSAKNTCNKLVGRTWDEKLVTDVCQLLLEEIPLPHGSPGGMENFRSSLMLGFFYKFYLTVQIQLQKKLGLNEPKIPQSYRSAVLPYSRGPTQSSQYFKDADDEQPSVDAVGRPIPHESAVKQTTGEAIFVDDMPEYRDELYLSLVVNIPGEKRWGYTYLDEDIFAIDVVSCQGQIIGAVIADTKQHAQRAAKAVEVTYDEEEPILTIKQAIKQHSFYEPNHSIKCGDLTSGFHKASHVLDGEISIGGQEHFYMETQVSLAIPKEDNEIEMFVASQNPAQEQELVAAALGIPSNKVLIRVKRMGGGFGGKELRASLLSLPVAIAANKLQVPVRCMVDRDEDMITFGGRHPFLGQYRVGCSAEGKIIALEVDLYCNAGNSRNSSNGVNDRALFHIDNSYKIPNLHVTAHQCKTNIPSNTAFRGYGAPQSMFVMEAIISEIASSLKIPPEQVRKINFYQEGDHTHYNQELTQLNIRRCWEECEGNSDFHTRRKMVDMFNSENRWRKRGLSIVPTKFGIDFTLLHFNQTSVLVHIYKDGSVLLALGGTEMGQGLYTKMIQVATRVLGVPMSKIHISETSTATVGNAAPTAASSGSDLNGMAVMFACQTLKKRLEPYISAKPKDSWEDWVKAAYFDRVHLSATGFYKTPDIGYSFQTGTGKAYSYFTVGVACSEVEIDCLTGDHQVLRTDIVMDVGKSLNPAIDVGQIEGAFMQGYGLFILEQIKVSPSGCMLTRGPGAYKIPSLGNIPREFNVSLLKESENDRAVYSSKGIGEPPLFLASSIFFAVKDAIQSARSDAGHGSQFCFHSPATPERIRMACKDQFTEMFSDAPEGSYVPWFVNL
ncbi:hypothetical protein ScPMuIL_013821 [Solemya velum]